MYDLNNKKTKGQTIRKTTNPTNQQPYFVRNCSSHGFTIFKFVLRESGLERHLRPPSMVFFFRRAAVKKKPWRSHTRTIGTL